MRNRELGLSSALAEQVIELLESGPQDPAGWREQAAGLEQRFGDEVYPVLLFVLAQLDFGRARAREQWESVLRQWERLNASVPGGVDLRVAVLQHFLHGQRRLRNPAIVEIRILRRVQDSAVYDELTRLHNFRYFQDRAASEARRAERYGAPLSLLMIDVDDFKGYNDARGHLAGNLALRRLAAALRRSLREADVVARYGGEEFAVLLPSTPKLAALKVAEKLRQSVERSRIGLEPGRLGRPLTVSVGVACLPGDARQALELVDRADRALYLAKSMGKNCVAPFSDERRGHGRLDAVLPGHYGVVEAEAHALTTLNVSEDGLLFHSEEPLAAGVILRIQLGLPPAGEPVECVGRVLRVTGAHGGFQIGAQIVHMPKLHQRRFRRFLSSLEAGELAAAGQPAARATSARTRVLAAS